MEKTSKKREALRWIIDIGIAVVIAILIASFFGVATVKETSMLPNVEEGDVLILNKMAYVGKLTPQRGDIVVFKSDLETSSGSKKLLIKRVVGLPGETITIKDGKLYIDGEEYTENYTYQGITTGSIDNLVIPDGYYFCMGDNRAVSLDSRSDQVGCISEDKIVGKVILRVYPFSKFGTLENPYKSAE